jgi:hypothetical protein
MSNLDVDPNFLFIEWINQPNGDYSLLGEQIDPKDLPMVKYAFLSGYEIGLGIRRENQWQEQNQK